jgi:hypothetical protein
MNFVSNLWIITTSSTQSILPRRLHFAKRPLQQLTFEKFSETVKRTLRLNDGKFGDQLLQEICDLLANGRYRCLSATPAVGSHVSIIQAPLDIFELTRLFSILIF